jgi:MFS family permease
VSPSLPPGSFNAHWFNFFNAVSFQIMMGAPIILFTKSLGASSTVIGIVASFTPLMTIFQLPAARFLDRFGYREFVLMGWGLRTVLIFVIAAVPMLSFLDAQSKMAVLLATLFLFNLLRGISSAAWMPWIAELIPESRRGRFLSLDQLFMYAGCLVSLAVSAVVMAGQVDPWEYSLVFFMSAFGGVMSLVFIKRIPEVSSQESVKRSSTPVPWKEMLSYPPFLQILVFNILYMAVVGSLGVFTVEYMKEMMGFEVSAVLVLSAFSFVGALMALPFCGRVIDRTGSKPLLLMATLLFFVVIFAWFLLASSVLPPSFVLVACLNLATGAASAIFNLANVRIVMATMPEMGRNHFFALFTVITSLGLGASPVVWGLTLDAIGTIDIAAGVFTFKRHSVYFLALLVFNMFSALSIRWLAENPSANSREPNLVYARLKRGSKFWHR